MQRVIVLGCGYLGQRIAKQHLLQGDEVICIVRSPSRLQELSILGFPVVSCDLDQPALLPELMNAQLYYLVPPPNSGITDPRVANLIELFQEYGHPRRVLYVSTTGVYGHCDGDWVSEDRPPQPHSQRAQRRYSAEQSWRDWSEGQIGSLAVLRVAGIYGPGQLPLQRLRQGLPMIRGDQSPFSNRVHIDDLVEVCTRVMNRGMKYDLFNVSDGHPTTMTDYFCQIADLAGLPRPPLIALEQAQAQLSTEMMGYISESRRVANRKMLRELGLTLRYPNLQEGLGTCFDDPTDK